MGQPIQFICCSPMRVWAGDKQTHTYTHTLSLPPSHIAFPHTLISLCVTIVSHYLNWTGIDNHLSVSQQGQLSTNEETQLQQQRK